MALILCIETGTDICSVALARNGDIISLRESTQGRDHARNLGVFIDEILRSNDVDPHELDAVAVGKGPGSYTGLRIGISMAKALCYSLNIPLMGIGSLEALTAVAIEDYQAGIVDIENFDTARLCPMIDARRMEVYAQVFDHELNALTPIDAHIITPESFEDQINDGEFVIFGNGAVKCLDVMTKPQIKLIEVVPSARGIVPLAYKAFTSGRFEDVAYFEPLYLKDFIVLKSKKKFF